MGRDVIRSVRRAPLLLALVAGFVAGSAMPALAACHAFMVSASPSSVTEGGKATVTVERDGNYLPSSIDLSTLDKTAKAGKDYKSLNTRVEFTSDTSQTFTVSTINDSIHEATETFALHLSDPQGCSGSGYSVGPDATVKIIDNDASPSSSATPTHTSTPTSKPTATATVESETRHASGVPTTSTKPSPRASATKQPSSRQSPAPTVANALAQGAEDRSSNGMLAGILVSAVTLLVVVGLAVRRLRSRER